MTFSLDQWKQEIEPNGRLFGTLLQPEPNIHTKYMVATALLWSIRQADRHGTLALAVPNADQQADILHAIDDWSAHNPVTATKALRERATNNQHLQIALNALIVFFLDDLIRSGLLQRTTNQIDIQGDVRSSIANIGGTQYILGDVFVTQLSPAKPYSREDYHADVAARLQRAGLKIDKDKDAPWQSSIPRTVASGRITNRKFMVWFMLSDFETIRVPELEQYSKDCVQYAAKSKTLLHRMENIFVVAVAVADHLDTGTCDGVRASHPKISLFGEVELPIAVDLTTTTLHHSMKTPLHVQGFLPYMREQIRQLLAPN